MALITAVSTRWSAPCVRAIACSSSRTPIRIGWMQSSARPPRWRLRLRQGAPKTGGGSPAHAETVRRLAAALLRNRNPASPFPWAAIALDGWIENALMEQPATEVEDRYRTVLRGNRARDAAAGRTTDGPQLTDLDVLYGPKGIAADRASTGEQKALLIGLILAHASLVAEMTGYAPLLLLDEVIAHLDPGRRAALFDALAALAAQVWMTGADPAPFADVASRAQMFAVGPGRVSLTRDGARDV